MRRGGANSIGWIAEAWTKAGEVGLLLTDVPEEYGGGGRELRV